MSRQKILIVDDEPNIRLMLARMIEPLNHDVAAAADGVEALECIRAEPVDLVISDLAMPRMGGLELLEQVRTEGFDCAYIILTGFGDLPQALAARERYNIANFLVKPIHNMDQFLFDVESALSRRLLERENRSLMERLRSINANLEVKVRERTAELEQKNAALDRLSRFRADAIKVIGHELRTPLAILSGYYALAAQAAPEAMAGLTPPMEASIERLQEIVEKALSLLRAGQAPEFPLELAEVRPEVLLRSIADRISPLVALRHIEIVLSGTETEIPPCRWDRAKIEELVEELLINAIRASEDGSRIVLSVVDEGDDAVQLVVKDTGVGIPPDQRERVFEPFVTLDRADHHSSGQFDFGAAGVGIGLSTAQLWATIHGGRIDALAGDGGRGTAMAVHLPRRAGNRAGSAPAGEPDEAAQPGTPLTA